MLIPQESFSDHAPSRPVKGKPIRTTRGNSFQRPGTTVPNRAARELRFGIATDEIKVTMVKRTSARDEWKVLRSMSLANIQAQVIAAQWLGFEIHSYGSEIV